MFVDVNGGRWSPDPPEVEASVAAMLAVAVREFDEQQFARGCAIASYSTAEKVRPSSGASWRLWFGEPVEPRSRHPKSVADLDAPEALASLQESVRFLVREASADAEESRRVVDVDEACVAALPRLRASGDVRRVIGDAHASNRGDRVSGETSGKASCG